MGSSAQWRLTTCAVLPIDWAHLRPGTPGRYPDVPRALLQDLVKWLAPHLRTVQTEVVADQGRMRSPVRLTRIKVEFRYKDDTAGVTVAEYGPYSASTNEGLVRIMKGDRHVGTISQGRWSRRRSLQLTMIRRRCVHLCPDG
jgi:hypothetical protein